MMKRPLGLLGPRALNWGGLRRGKSEVAPSEGARLHPGVLSAPPVALPPLSQGGGGYRPRYEGLQRGRKRLRGEL